MILEYKEVVSYFANMETEKQLISVTDAANYFDCSAVTIYSALKGGRLTERRVGAMRLIVKDKLYSDFVVFNMGPRRTRRKHTRKRMRLKKKGPQNE